MDAIRDLGLQPEIFSYLIGVVIVIGGAWAVVRLYQDLTGPVHDFYRKDYDPYADFDEK